MQVRLGTAMSNHNISTGLKQEDVSSQHVSL